MTTIPFQPVPQDVHATDEYLRRFATVALNTQNGKLNNTGTVTLGSGTTTEVSDQRAGGMSVILFMPTNADAATEFASGSMYVSARGTRT